MVLISLLVVLICEVIISGLRIVLFLSVDIVSVYRSVGVDCRREMGYMARAGHAPSG